MWLDSAATHRCPLVYNLNNPEQELYEHVTAHSCSTIGLVGCVLLVARYADDVCWTGGWGCCLSDGRLQASAVEGLQVLKRDTGKWVRLLAPPGSIIINVGDYLQRVTNDVLPSTTHRVAPPRDPALRKACRTSFPLAIYINEHDMLTCLPSCGKPKYTPESAIDFHTAITAKYYGEHYRRDNGED